MRYKLLYAGVLIGLMLLVVVSLGSGIRGLPADYSSWQYSMFRGICHQMAERSFHINEIPMAVNARCFGVFTGLLASWLIIPLLMKRTANKTWPLILLMVAVIIQIADNTAGLFSVWNSSNFSRFFMGNILGAAVVCMIADRFKPNRNARKKRSL